MQGELASIFTEEQKLSLINLKLTFPFRICWSAVNADTGEFIKGAGYTRHRMNQYLRKGWLVFEAKAGAP